MPSPPQPRARVNPGTGVVVVPPAQHRELGRQGDNVEGDGEGSQPRLCFTRGWGSPQPGRETAL